MTRPAILPMGVEVAEAMAVTRSVPTVSFPRADANPDALYREMYIIESRKTARAWVQHCFELYGSWPGNLAAGCCLIEASASAEIGRPLNANERELIERVVRDLLIARETIARHDERARVLAREVL